MIPNDPQQIIALLQAQIQPWREAVADPAKAQEAVLHRYLRIYAGTEYGRQRGAEHIGSIADFRRAFPVMTYEDYKPLIDRVMAGEVGLLLTEPPIGWAITRGTTGDSKFIPMTPTDMGLRSSAGRAMMAYVASTRHFDLLAGVNLNLNFPSTVGTIRVGSRDISYGYSSGIYTKYVSTFTPIR